MTAERQGHIAATTGWVGSEANPGGDAPTYFRPYADRMPLQVRVDEVLAYLDLPPEQRPSFITLYSDWIDNHGHIYGPGSPEELAAIRDVDRVLGRLIDGLDQRGLSDRVNVVIVADHGMAPILPGQRIVLDDYIDLLGMYAEPAQGGFAYLWPKNGDVETIYNALQGRPGLQIFRREEMPDRFRYRNNSRVAPLVAIADVGWTFASRADAADSRGVESWGGTHGLDNEDPSMRALFLAFGPAFKRGVTTPDFSSTQVAALVAAILEIDPAPEAAPIGEVVNVLAGD